MSNLASIQKPTLPNSLIMKNLPKIIVIVGVTASGKTKLAIELAKKFSAQGGPALGWNGAEIVSADSRQVYKEFDIGTAKPEGHWMLTGGERKFMADGVPHYLVDNIDPKENFTLADYKKQAVEKINKIIKAGKLPLLVGGTALYIKAVCENWTIPQVEPNLTLRKKLENKKTEDLYKELKRADPEAAVLTGSKNKRRIIRALEVIYQTGIKFSDQRQKGQPLFDCLKLGLKIPKEEFIKVIERRTGEMIKNGLVAEVKKLRKKYPWSLAPMQSIDYQEFKNYFASEIQILSTNKRSPPKLYSLLHQKSDKLKNHKLLADSNLGAKAEKVSLEETITLINQHHIAYAKRQMTWFKKDKDINWIHADPKLALTQATSLVKDFLTAK